MVKLAPKFIFVLPTRADIFETKHNFYQVAGFPGVIGCIDGSHIPIVALHEDEFAYVNRKKFHSINVQAICDSNLVFMDVVAKWPGSSHDSFILLTSAIHFFFLISSSLHLLGILIKNLVLSLLCMNIRSLNANFDKFNELLTNYDILPDIIAMSETKLKLSQVYNAKLSGYHFYHKGTTTRWGGVGYY